ncbi:MAG: hypothetical protein IPG50_26840 [Myxococcales bacterium]|nr:hypothetical protein [Myxococcales bacterium]
MRAIWWSSCSVTSSFFDIGTTGKPRVPLGAAGSDAAMKTQASYAGWDVTTVWQMGGRGYRVLR